MTLILRLLLNGLSIWFVAVLLQTLFPGATPVYVASYAVAILVSVIISLMNYTVKPILKLVTLPINLLTLGLFTWVLNGIVIMLVPYIVSIFVPGGFAINGLLWAIVYSALVSFVQSTLQILVK